MVMYWGISCIVEMYLTLEIQWTSHIVMQFKVSKGRDYTILESQQLNSIVPVHCKHSVSNNWINFKTSDLGFN